MFCRLTFWIFCAAAATAATFGVVLSTVVMLGAWFLLVLRGKVPGIPCTVYRVLFTLVVYFV